VAIIPAAIVPAGNAVASSTVPKVFQLDFGQNYSHEPLILFKKIVFQNSIIEF